MSIIRFYKALKSTISQRKPLSKLIAFKGIVFLNFIQNVCPRCALLELPFPSDLFQAVFSFLTSSNNLKPTSKLTFRDLSVGIPNLIISLEMVIFSVLFLYIYRTKEYYFKSGATAVALGHGGYQGGILGIRAYAQALNIVDILGEIVSVPRAFSEKRSSGTSTQKLWAAGAQVSIDSFTLASR
jgi:Organic solute transporter Ostalpha